ncbi:hypothetical protein PR048_015948 [Dryococelus australis]|uniref:Uncharacterized protein n=1 Tax=Dryococelus australis TaxID=614101 RepID=A0ABQ9HIW5_9NEOP|nr:hypothetical protein PR048_015948 [Dryococelus australis]
MFKNSSVYTKLENCTLNLQREEALLSCSMLVLYIFIADYAISCLKQDAYVVENAIGLLVSVFRVSCKPI